jgi:hypothetical protein
MSRKFVLVGLFVLLAAIGCLLLLLSSFGDASVIGSTGTVSDILAQHGLSDNLKLRSDLFKSVTRLQGPWAWVSNVGFATILVSLIGVAATLRTAR